MRPRATVATVGCKGFSVRVPYGVLAVPRPLPGDVERRRVPDLVEGGLRRRSLDIGCGACLEMLATDLQITLYLPLTLPAQSRGSAPGLRLRGLVLRSGIDRGDHDIGLRAIDEGLNFHRVGEVEALHPA